jgi:hypothetical protein
MEFTTDLKGVDIKIKSDAELSSELIALYESYINDEYDDEIRSNAYTLYTTYFNGADTIFNKSISAAIWGAFNILEKKLNKIGH